MTARSVPADTLLRRYQALRAAARAVLDAADDDPAPSQRTTELRALARAVREGDAGPRQLEPRPSVDPARHVLSMRRYDTGEPGSPITLARHARELRRDLESDQPARSVVVTEVRAVVIASLLEELAARLSPGPAFGAGTGGEELARIVGQLAAELLDQTFPCRL
jgi:hypothetical protein